MFRANRTISGSHSSNNAGKARSPLPVVLLHWLLVALIVVGFLSGQRIAGDHLLYRDTPLADWLPDGSVFVWHIAGAHVLSAVFLAYLMYALVTGRYRRFRLNGFDLRNARNRRTVLNRLLLLTGLVLLGGLIVTGILTYSESPVSTVTVRKLHRLLSWLVVAYPVPHILLLMLDGGVPRLLSMLYAKVTGPVTAALLLAVSAAVTWWLLPLVFRPLVLPRVVQAPVVDGKPDDAVWTQAVAATLYTKLGNNDSGAVTPVSVRGVYDGERAYLLLSWPDRTASLAHLPLVKREPGWRMITQGYEIDDEVRYYEDKLAVMLSNAGPLAAMQSIHLGDTPLADARSPRHRRGYHYTTDGGVLDVWHWKAVRTNNYFQADDNYFGPPRHQRACDARYKAGYMPDPSLGGGFADNIRFFRRTGVTPLRLPRSSRHRAALSASAPATDLPVNLMRVDDGVPFHSDLDKLISAGTQIPSILAKEPLQGDRGNVGAKGGWSDGYWHLEMSRALDTGSPYDVAVSDGTFLWVAVFDHAQTRHSYHLWPLRIRLGAGAS